ncbi:hypothetical protein Daus18300_012257 [Diaporthe australafricana]|uniref:CCHC-type domain-containing protein n=1 Tax=Diaporthe australafricana TaxID=127596 RepID=A0ABR3W3G4_9PEZI
MDTTKCTCGGIGHNVEVCPSKPMEGRTCHNCRGQGHLAKDCPSASTKKRGRTSNDDDNRQTKRAKLDQDEKAAPAQGTIVYFEQQIAAETKNLARLVEKRRNLKAELCVSRGTQSTTD